MAAHLFTVLLLAILCWLTGQSTGDAVGTQQGQLHYLHPLSDASFNTTAIPYECWDPKNGLSRPVVTIVSVVPSGTPFASAVTRNRQAFAFRHHYRYCQLSSPLDNTRSIAYSKIPFMMAVLPCTDYAIYIDGNAMFANHALTVAPWLAHMQAKDIDLLISESNHKDAPIDLGVFAMRPAPWLLTLFKELYNRCACDMGRLHDWPAEQGMLYDLLAGKTHEPWFQKVQVAKSEGWNRHPTDFPTEVNSTMLQPDDLVMRLLGVPSMDTGGSCGVDGVCNLQQFQQHVAQAVKDKLIQHLMQVPPGSLRPSKCLPISHKSFTSEDANQNSKPEDRAHSSILDWQTTRQGHIKEITLGDIPCMGRHESKCDVPHHWATTTTHYLWTQDPLEPLSKPPLDASWASLGSRASHTGQASASALATAHTSETHMSRAGQSDALHPAAAALKLSYCQDAMKGLDRELSCPRPCLDVVFLYHEDDKPMFVDHGVLQAARKHLRGVRNFYIISKSNQTFEHLMDERTFWVDEKTAPFSVDSWKESKSPRPKPWLYQQTLKLWAANGNIDGSCENVMFIDSDTLFLKDFDPVHFEVKDQECKAKFKYNLATMKTGAWYGDITNALYHHFVEHVTGLPKARKNHWTAINHWQIMQRDVVAAMERTVMALRGARSLVDGLIQYGMTNEAMSEYEAYFSFVWTYYRDRVRVEHLPYVMREPKMCDYKDKQNDRFKEDSIVLYFTCHDNMRGEWYTNCLGRDSACDP